MRGSLLCRLCWLSQRDFRWLTLLDLCNNTSKHRSNGRNFKSVSINGQSLFITEKGTVTPYGLASLCPSLAIQSDI